MMPYCFFRDGSGALLAVFVSIVRFLVVHSLDLLSFGGDAFVCLCWRGLRAMARMLFLL